MKNSPTRWRLKCRRFFVPAEQAQPGDHGPGDTFTADKNTTDWMENKGTAPAVMIVTGIGKSE